MQASGGRENRRGDGENRESTTVEPTEHNSFPSHFRPHGGKGHKGDDCLAIRGLGSHNDGQSLCLTALGLGPRSNCYEFGFRLLSPLAHLFSMDASYAFALCMCSSWSLMLASSFVGWSRKSIPFHLVRNISSSPDSTFRLLDCQASPDPYAGCARTSRPLPQLLRCENTRIVLLLPEPALSFTATQEDWYYESHRREGVKGLPFGMDSPGLGGGRVSFLLDSIQSRTVGFGWNMIDNSEVTLLCERYVKGHQQ